jgi:N-acetylneuraminic acid mutarotase
VQEAYTWSSTTYASDTGQAWAMDLSSGGLLPWPKSTLLRVWAVRAGATGSPDPGYPANVWKTGQTASYAAGDDGALQKGVSWLSPRLTANGDGTVTDSLTGLTWLQDVQCLGGYDWYELLGRIVTLNQSPASLACTGYTAAHADWRLPNRQELLSLLDFGQADTSWPINSPFVHGDSVPSGRFWTSSTDPFWSTWFLGADLVSDPFSGPGNFNSGYAAVAVRGGGPTCSYSISPTAASFGHAGGNGSTDLTASEGSCGWTVAQRVSWVVPTSSSPSNGSATVNYTVQANPTTQPRTGTLAVSGRLLTVTQDGAPCTFTFSPSGQTFGAAGGPATLQVNVPGSDCAWTAASSDPWITLTGGLSGSGKGLVSYTLDANPGSGSRSGSLTIAGQTFPLTQAAHGVVPDVWTPRAPMPAARSSLGAAGHDGRVYAVGGGVNGASSSIESYDPGTDLWSVRTTMSTGRSGLGVVELGGRIYALSGWDGNGLLANTPTVEAYDPGADSWSPRASMLTGRRAFAAAAANGRIYAFGGCDAACNALSAAEEYDPATDVWTARAPLPTPRRGAAAASVNGKVYVIGGCPATCNSLGTVEEYDPATNTWTSRTPMPTARSFLAAVALGGRIYALGGLTGSNGTTLATVEVYDPATDSWSAAAPLVTARYSFGAAVAGGRIYVVGGRTGSGLAQTAALEQYTPRPSLSIDGASVTEWNAGTAAAAFTLSLSEASSEEITVQAATADGTATAGEDYASASSTVTFPPGTTTKTFPVTVHGDTAVEPDETFTVQLSNPGQALLGAARTGTGTIVDDDAAAAAGFDLYTLAPCRVLDTRSGSPLASGVVSTFAVAGSCGIPADARAVVLSLTAVSPTGNGNLSLFPGGTSPPATSSINFQAGLNRANNAVLALAPDGAGTLGVRASVAGGGQVHLLLDVTGYYK